MDFFAWTNQAIVVAKSYGWSPYIFLLLCLWCLFFAYRIYKSDRRSLPREFTIFAGTSYPAAKEQLTLTLSEFQDAFAQKHGGGQINVIKDDRFYSPEIDFVAAVKESVEAGKRPILVISPIFLPVDIDLGQSRQKEDFVVTEGPHRGLTLRYPHIDQVRFEQGSANNHHYSCMRGARILRVVIDESFHGIVYFEDCWIGSLEIKGRVATQSTLRLSLSRCYVGHLNMGANGCSTFSMFKGGIRGLRCPHPSQPSPVTNLFDIDEAVILHQEPKHVDAEQVGIYRDLLFHIRGRSSPFSQQLLSAAVMRLERKGETGFLGWINFCYEIFSSYNTRPGRPLIWMLLSIGICSYVAYALDLAVVTKTYVATESSWVATLYDPSVLGKASRSLVLTLNALMNPFGIFSDNTLLQSRTLSFNLVLIITALLNMVWIALAAFSIKTRFGVKN